MATFNIVLDTRTKLKKDQYNLTIRLVIGNDVMYLNISKMTERQWEQVFVRKSQDEQSIKYRETCFNYIPKCERIFNELKPFDKKRFRELFYEKEKKNTQSLLLKDLIDIYLSIKVDIEVNTKAHLRSSINVLDTFQTGISVLDVTPDFLNRFEKSKLEEGCSLATVSSILRDLRMLINYFTHKDKKIPDIYNYPFGQGGFSISTYFPSKFVMKADEITSLIEFTDYDDLMQEYSLNIWLLLYRCNGINFADLLRMKWDNIHREYIFLTRKKTENTRKNNRKQIVIPIDQKLQKLLNKVGEKDSPYILGMLKNGYTKTTFANKNHKFKAQINKHLSKIALKLKLSVPLTLATARDCYATTLMRNGATKDEVGEMMGHSTAAVTEHYIAPMEIEKTFKINARLL